MISHVSNDILHELKSASLVDHVFLKFFGPISLNKRPFRGLYIRPCYHRLLEFIKNGHATLATHKPSILVLGDPGMGKTFFSYFLIHYLINAKQNVVYDSVGNKHVYYYRAIDDKFVPGDLNDGEIQELLKSDSSWFVVDGCEPKITISDLRARIVLLSTSKKSNFFSFEKYFLVDRFYIPRWSFDELLVCKNAFFESITDQELMTLLDKFGPAPRYLFDKAQLNSIHSVLDESIKRFDLESVMNNFGELDEFETISDVVHLNVDEKSLQNKGIVFASDYIARRVIKNHLEFNEDLLKRAVVLSIRSDYFLDIRPVLFRSYALHRLAKGGQFKLNDLHSSQDTWFLMPPRELKTFSKPEDIAKQKDYQKCMWASERSTSSQVDGYMYPNYFFFSNSFPEPGLSKDFQEFLQKTVDSKETKPWRKSTANLVHLNLDNVPPKNLQICLQNDIKLNGDNINLFFYQLFIEIK